MKNSRERDALVLLMLCMQFIPGNTSVNMSVVPVLQHQLIVQLLTAM